MITHSPYLLVVLMLGLALAACQRSEPGPTRQLDRTTPRHSPPPVTLPRTEVRLLPSQRVEGVTYKLYVSLPRGYKEGEQHYPVVYLLDADYSFAIARNIVEHLADRGQLPRLLLVGIAYDGPPRYYENRTRDYTPTHVTTGPPGPEILQYSGGAPAFLDFIVDELIPFIEDTYRVTNERVLVGHSFGALFGTWLAFTTPKLFDHYLLVSPSLWYDDRVVFKIEENFNRSHDTFPATLYFAVGELEHNKLRNMPADLRAFTRQVEQHEYHDLIQRVEIMENETHNSIFPRALSNGLRATDWAQE